MYKNYQVTKHTGLIVSEAKFKCHLGFSLDMESFRVCEIEILLMFHKNIRGLSDIMWVTIIYEVLFEMSLSSATLKSQHMCANCSYRHWPQICHLTFREIHQIIYKFLEFSFIFLICILFVPNQTLAVYSFKPLGRLSKNFCIQQMSIKCKILCQVLEIFINYFKIAHIILKIKFLYLLGGRIFKGYYQFIYFFSSFP